MKMDNYLYQSDELSINGLGKELDNYKKRMQQFILKFSLQTEAEHLFGLRVLEALSQVPTSVQGKQKRN